MNQILGNSEAGKRTYWGERGGAMALHGKTREAGPCFIHSEKLLGLFLIFIPRFYFLVNDKRNLNKKLRIQKGCLSLKLDVVI